MTHVPRRTRRFGKRLWSGFAAATSLLAVVAIITPDWIAGQWWLLLTCVVVGLVWAGVGLRRPWPAQRYRDDRVHIRLISGDLFAQGEPALVGMSSTFDTDVAGGIIGRASVQASFLEDIYGGDVSRLDADLSRSLAGVSRSGTIAKTGKTDVFPLGTVATLVPTSGVPYYCVAYCDMDASNRATGTIPSILKSLEAVWTAADAHGNKRPICVPLIGNGAARISQFPVEVAVRIIAFSFLLHSRRSHFSDELRIVVHPKDVESIDLDEFQAFLKSLVPK